MEEENFRSICKKKAEALEHWLRRVIDENYIQRYGEDYFQFQFDNGENLIKKDIVQKVKVRRNEQPERYSRDIDATLLEDLIAIICKQKQYSEVFKEVFNEVAPQGNEHLRFILNKIWETRNPLSHANPISVRQAEQLICYSNDIIECLQNYYKKKGEGRMYNVPTVLKYTDSFGNTIYREQMIKSGNGKVCLNFINDEKYYLRPEDVYSIELEIDPSFERDTYRLKWFVGSQIIESDSNRLVVELENKHVSEDFYIACWIITKNDWHRYSVGYDDEIVINLRVFPPY